MKYVRFGMSSLALAAMTAGMMVQPVQMQQAKAAAPRTPAAPPKAPPAAPPAAPTAPATPAAVAAASAPSTAPALPYKLEVGGPPPERTRAFGGDGPRTPSPLMAQMVEMPLPEGENYAQFFVPIPDDAVPATITDPDEIEKAMKEASRKLVNNLGGISRRIKKKDDTFNVTMRETIEQHPQKPGVTTRGVRVWRILPIVAAEGTEAPATS